MSKTPYEKRRELIDSLDNKTDKELEELIEKTSKGLISLDKTLKLLRAVWLKYADGRRILQDINWFSRVTLGKRKAEKCGLLCTGSQDYFAYCKARLTTQHRLMSVSKVYADFCSRCKWTKDYAYRRALAIALEKK